MKAETTAPGHADATTTAVKRARRLSVPRRDIVLMLVLFALAIAPRAAWAAYNDRTPQGLNDPSLYMIYGAQIADGHGYTRFTGEATAYYPVGFPAMVAALNKGGDIFGWGRSVFSIKMMNGMFGAITVLLVYLLARRLADRRVAFGAGALMAIFPGQVFVTGAVLSEPLFTMLLVTAILVLLWDPWDRDGMPWPRLFGVGLLLSAATMTRAITLAFPLLLLLFWLFYLRSKKRAVVQTLIVFAGLAVLTVPWSVRNTVRMGQLTGTSTNLGDDFCIGNFSGAHGAFSVPDRCFAGYEGLPVQEAEVKRNREGVKIGLKDIAHHPGRMPELIGNKAYYLLYTDSAGLSDVESYGLDQFIPAVRRGSLAFAANAIYFATGALAIAGAAAFARARDIRRAVLLATVLYILALPLVFFGNPRFHYPAIPFVVVIAVTTVVALWDRRHRALLELRS